MPTSSVFFPSGRVKETWGSGFETKNGERGGELVNWIRMLVHPESAMRGDKSNGGVDARADTGDGRDTGGRGTVEHRRLRNGWVSDWEVRSVTRMGRKRNSLILIVRLRV